MHVKYLINYILIKNVVYVVCGLCDVYLPCINLYLIRLSSVTPWHETIDIKMMPSQLNLISPWNLDFKSADQI